MRPTAKPTTMRCAIYTRKSTEEGLEQEFNSLDAQREAGEAYVRSQAGEGWILATERYDDGGFTGGNMDRPALRRLLVDIEAGKVDAVVVYKVDRLSRSLLDFARMMQVFDERRVSFVSVTQQFNTATSMGRLVLNVLLSFAQFEREIISERTRDKIAATRRKGKWAGGHPILGYDVDPNGFKLVVNEAEAVRVRSIFAMYLERESLLAVTTELERLGWRNKRWTTRSGRERGGKPFTRTSLYQLLTNVAYAGKVRYKDEVHAGEQVAIVDESTWDRVQATLSRNGRAGGGAARNRFGALLKGLVRCVPCGCAMTPSHSTRGERRFRCYVCSSAQKRGWHTCESKSVPAGQLERLVLDRVSAIGRDATVRRETLAELMRQEEAAARERERELRAIETQLRNAVGDAVVPLRDRAQTLRDELAAAGTLRLSEDDAGRALESFGPVWSELGTAEQVRLIRLLVERVDFDGAAGRVTIAFRRTGIAALTREGGERS